MMNMNIGVRSIGDAGERSGPVTIQEILLCLSLLVVMPGLVVAAEEEAASKDQATESEQPAGASEPGELEPGEEPAADSSTEIETALAAGEEGDANEASSGENTADDAVASPAQIALRQALDTVSALQLVLASEHDGDGPLPGQLELSELRRSLEDALVELTRLEQQQSLRQWLEGEGLRVALAEFETDRAREEAQEALEEAAVAKEGAAESDSIPVDAARLRGVKRAIEDAPFKEGKMQVLTDQLRDAKVSSEQVAELIELFAFSRDKVESLVFLYPRLVDPERFDELLATLKFASDRMAVRQRLGLSGS
jgi:hypothetical protein